MIQNKFISGKLNMDVASEVMPKGDYRDARNILVSRARGTVKTIPSNWQVSDFTLPDGRCRVVGAKADITRNRIIYMVWNENGYHCILQYNTVTKTTSKIVVSKTDSGGVDILGFQEFKPINNIEILHRDTEGDLLFFTEGSSAPKGFIIDKIASGAYGVLDAQLIEAAKRPPLDCPKVSYGDDANRNINTLRRKLYQFAYRYVYDTYEKSTWSSFSINPLPIGLLGTDVDMDGTKNNYIDIAYKTGAANVTHIEIAARESLGQTWSDMFLVTSINKAEHGLQDNAEESYKFYNDGIFPALDIRESLHSFDWYPRYAETMTLVNGNVITYGAITEGFDRLTFEELDVEIASELFTNIGVDLGPTRMNYVNESNLSGILYTFNLAGYIQAGTTIEIIAFVPGIGSVILSKHTTVTGDTIGSVIYALFLSTDPDWASAQAVTFYQVLLPAGSYIIHLRVINPATSSATGEISCPTPWNWYSRYKLGLVYFDENGRTAGVETSRIFEVETQGIELDTGQPRTPIISAEINHLAPPHAKKFCWVRSKNLAMDKYFYYGTHDMQSDADHFYFGFGNIAFFKDINDKFIYSNIESVVAPQDRIRVMTKWNVAPGYGDTVYNHDYEILGVVERQVTGGAETEKAKYIKVRKPKNNPPTNYVEEMMCLIYTPARNIAVDEATVYFEFGEKYDILPGGYHQGSVQDQSAASPARYQFLNGDIYYRPRTMYKDLFDLAANKTDIMVMDSNYSDYFISSVNADGRPQAEDVNAREVYNPVLLRFSQEHVTGSTVNGLNRFYFDNAQELNRSNGAIRRLRQRDNQMRVFQQFKCGWIPVYAQVVTDATGSSSLLQSDKLFNDWQPYVGNFGIGDAAASLASENYADYFCDTVNGVFCRISLDGLTPLSLTENFNTFSAEAFPLRAGGDNIYGCFVRFENDGRYIGHCRELFNAPAESFVFNEKSNGLESFLDLNPEMMITLGSTLYSFKEGELWVHENRGDYCRFFGDTYYPYITVIFNDIPQSKKKFIAITQQATAVWEPVLISTSIGQASELLTQDFRMMGGNFHASFLRDRNSPKGLLRGDTLEGTYLQAKLQPRIPSDYNELFLADVKFNIHNLNNR
jgi:hypothetical protein